MVVYVSSPCYSGMDTSYDSRVLVAKPSIRLPMYATLEEDPPRPIRTAKRDQLKTPENQIHTLKKKAMGFDSQHCKLHEREEDLFIRSPLTNQGVF